MERILLNTLLNQLHELCIQQQEKENSRATAEVDLTTLSEEVRKYRKILTDIQEEIRQCKDQLLNHLHSCTRFSSASHESQESKQSKPVTNGLEEVQGILEINSSCYKKNELDVSTIGAEAVLKEVMVDINSEKSEELSTVKSDESNYQLEKINVSSLRQKPYENKFEALTKDALEDFYNDAREELQRFKETQRKLEMILSTVKHKYADDCLQKINEFSDKMSDYLEKIQANTTNNDLQAARYGRIVFDQYRKARTCYLRAAELFLNGDNIIIAKQLIKAAEIFVESVNYAKNLAGEFSQNDLVHLNKFEVNMNVSVEVNEKVLKLWNQVGSAYQNDNFTMLKNHKEPLKTIRHAWIYLKKSKTIRTISLWKRCIEEMDFETEESTSWQKAFRSLEYGFKLIEKDVGPAYEKVLKYVELSARYYFSNDDVRGNFFYDIAERLATVLGNYFYALYERKRYEKLLQIAATDERINECRQWALKVSESFTNECKQFLQKLQINVEEVLENIQMKVEEDRDDVFSENQESEITFLKSMLNPVSFESMKQTMKRLSFYEKAAIYFTTADNLRMEFPKLLESRNDFNQSIEYWDAAGRESYDLGNYYNSTIVCDKEAKRKEKLVQYYYDAACYFTSAGGGTNAFSESKRNAAICTVQRIELELSGEGPEMKTECLKESILCFKEAAHYFKDSERSLEPYTVKFRQQIALYYQQFGSTWKELVISPETFLSVKNKIQESYKNGIIVLNNLEKYLQYLQPLPLELEKAKTVFLVQIAHGVVQISLDVAIYWREEAKDAKNSSIRNQSDAKIQSLIRNAENELNQSKKFLDGIIRCCNAFTEATRISRASEENDLTTKQPLSNLGNIEHLTEKVNNKLDQAWKSLLKANRSILDLYTEKKWKERW